MNDQLSAAVRSAGSKRKARAAEPGSLDREVARDLAVLRAFAANRERLIATLFGRQTRQNLLRDELLRMVVAEFGDGHVRRVLHYVRECAAFGTAPSVRSMIELMDYTGLVVLTADAHSRTSKLVVPTGKLIDFYNTQMPRLRDEVLELIAAAPDRR